jgi:hypothetical protein
MSVKYPTLESWLDEVEGFAVRRERLPPEALEWVEAAWYLALYAGIEKGRLMERAHMASHRDS